MLDVLDWSVPPEFGAGIKSSFEDVIWGDNKFSAATIIVFIRLYLILSVDHPFVPIIYVLLHAKFY